MPENLYETTELLSQYLLFHYGGSAEQLPYAFGPHSALNYPARCIGECVDASQLTRDSRALDLGCAVGRSTFELARICGQVLGVDYSRSFIQAATRLKVDGSLAYKYKVVGNVHRPALARIDPAIDRNRVSFEIGDAHELKNTIGVYDIVLAANLLCRLPNPRRLLHRFTTLVAPGGQLVITTPLTWLEAFTPEENWLGATPCTGDTLRLLETELNPSFSLQRTHDMPFLIREHARKYQWSVAQASIWRRKP